MKKTIGIDIDGVLADFVQGIIGWVGVENVDPINDWNAPFIVEHYPRIKNNPDFWLSLPPLVDPKILSSIRVNYYVTSRSISSAVSKKWLLDNGFPDAPVLSLGHGLLKSSVIAPLGITDFLDDAAHNAEDISRNSSCNCFLLNQPWNANSPYERRVNSVEEFIEIQMDS